MEKRLRVGYFIDRVIEDAGERIKHVGEDGYYVDGLVNDFAQGVLSGVLEGAEDYDLDLLVFPGRYFQPTYIDIRTLNYEYQYDHIFQYASENNIDILLVLMGCTGDIKQQGEKMRLVAELEKRGLPVITIAAELDKYRSIMYDNERGLINGITHLITEHGKTKIGFVSGSKENEDARIRLGAYKKILEKFRIPFDESLVKYGNFTEFCEEQVEELLDEGVDSIVFANDQMAVGGYKVFKRRGIVPGRDIAVMGFDNAEVGKELNPPLTTVSADPRALGYEAMFECSRYARNKQLEDRKVFTQLLIRRSCGCGAEHEETPAAFDIDEEILINTHETTKEQKVADKMKMLGAVQRDMMMLDGSSDVNLIQLVSNLKCVGISSSYLYLYEHAKVYRAGDAWKRPKSMYLKVIQNGKDVEVVPPNKQIVLFEDILNNDFYSADKRHSYFIMPLFMQEEQYGVLVCEMNSKDITALPTICHQMSLGLKFIYMLKKQEETSKKLHESNSVLDSVSKRDDLTGAYNRRGFAVEAQALLKVASNIGKEMAAFYADVDYLKTINVQFGHESGDKALDSAATVLKKVLGHDGVVGRLGGNAFVAIVPLGRGKDADYYIDQIDKELEAINQSSDIPYEIGISLGISTFVCDDSVVLKDIMSKAEDSLYQFKYNRAKNILV